MVANIRGYTPNYNFKLINFDTPRWHTLEYDNWNMLDNMFALLGTAPIRGEWANSTTYTAGDRVFDGKSGELYRCLTDHISAPTGTFAEDRGAAASGKWALQLGGVPVYRGTWMPATQFALGDIVVVGTYDYYLCTTSHLSAAAFATDAIYWQLVFSATQVMTDATAAKDAAATSASNASSSAIAAAGSATAAADSATAAEGFADSAENSAVTASNTQGAFRWDFGASTTLGNPSIGHVRFNNATPTNITELYISANTADTGNPDVSNWIVTWDDSTNTASRGTIYVRNSVDPENFYIFNLTGAVTDNGTWLQVGVTYVVHAGSFAAETHLSIAFARTGNSGTSGTGSGDMLRANNLSDVVSVSTSRSNLGLGSAQIPSFNQVTVNLAPSANNHVATKQYVDDLPDPPPPLIVQGTPPVIASSLDNSMWWDSDNGILYVLYNDGDSRQWVQAVALPVVDTAAFMPKSGGTMTGALTVPSPMNVNGSPISELFMNAAAGSYSSIASTVGGSSKWRWSLSLANGAAETGSNTGSDFQLYRCDDAGAGLASPIHIKRSTGEMTLGGPVYVTANLHAGTAGTANLYLDADNPTGAGMWSQIVARKAGIAHWSMSLGNEVAQVGSNTGSDFDLYRYSDTGALLGTPLKIYRMNGSAVFNSDAVVIKGASNNAVQESVELYLDKNATSIGHTCNVIGRNNSVYRWMLQLGDGSLETGGGTGSNFTVVGYDDLGNGFSAMHMDRTSTFLNLSWGLAVASANTYRPGGGVWLDSSDARIKTVLGDYTQGLAQIKQLNPVRYIFKGNDSRMPPQAAPREGEPEQPEQRTAHQEAAEENEEFIGLIAQDVEGVMPEMVSLDEAYIDGVKVDDLRILDTNALIFALINAVKELSARVEALEGGA